MIRTPDKRLVERLAKAGFSTEQSFYEAAFSRNRGLLSGAEQQALAKKTVGIPGLGGVGGVHLITLARTGLQHFVIADFDSFGVENMNRQYGARVSTVGERKATVMTREVQAINPYASVTVFEEGLTAQNIDSFLDSVDIVVDSLDFFAFDIRRALFMRARDKGKYVVTAGPIGFSCAMLIFAPETGLSFDDYFNIQDTLSTSEKTVRFQLGLTPDISYLSYVDTGSIDHDSRKGPSLGLATQLCSGMAATEVVRILLDRGGIKPVPHYARFDPYLRKYSKGYLPLGNRNPWQKCKISIARRLLAQGQKPPSRQQPANDSVSDMECILHSAIQAPSGDNTQPWQFVTGDDFITVHLAPGADTSRFNIEQRAVLISAGAVLENISIAAAARGKQANIEYTGSSDTTELAQVKLTASDSVSASLYEAIWRRCTNRKPFARRPLPDGTEEMLRQSLKDFPDVQLHLTSGREPLQKLRDAIRLADIVRTESRADHKFLYDHIRFSNKSAEQTADGFPLKNLEAGFAGELVLRATRNWSVMNALNGAGLGKVIATIASKGMLECSAAGLITVAGSSREELLRGGQALQRLWLTATDLGLSFQPMTAVTFYHAYKELIGLESVPPAHIARLEKAWAVVEDTYPEFSWSNQCPVLLFRIGFAKPIKAHTLRRPVQSFIKQARR